MHHSTSTSMYSITKSNRPVILWSMSDVTRCVTGWLCCDTRKINTSFFAIPGSHSELKSRANSLTDVYRRNKQTNKQTNKHKQTLNLVNSTSLIRNLEYLSNLMAENMRLKLRTWTLENLLYDTFMLKDNEIGIWSQLKTLQGVVILCVFCMLCW